MEWEWLHEHKRSLNDHLIKRDQGQQIACQKRNRRDIHVLAVAAPGGKELHKDGAVLVE